MPLPGRYVTAEGYEAETPDGMHIKISAIGKGNSANPDHLWAPGGGRYRPDRPTYPTIDNPAAKDGPMREIFYHLSARGDPDPDILVYLPEQARSGMLPDDRPYHGWGITNNPVHVAFEDEAHVWLYRDDPSASSVMFAVARGPWKIVDSFTSRLQGHHLLGKVVGEGPWGVAQVVAAPLDAGSGGCTGICATLVELQPPHDPVQEELGLRAYDRNGKLLEGIAGHNLSRLTPEMLSRIARFDVAERPYTFVLFKDVRFDPDPAAFRARP